MSVCSLDMFHGSNYTLTLTRKSLYSFSALVDIKYLKSVIEPGEVCAYISYDSKTVLEVKS